MTAVSIVVNGRILGAEVEPRTSVADFLRETHNLTGTHVGCEHGVCGACTLLIDGVPARSCIALAAACESADVTTIEGLEGDEITAELRDAFKREHALQCGYCTPGMLVSARDIVLRMEAPSERHIRVALSGNLCRCTGYVGIVRATQAVLAARRARGIAAIPDGGRKRLGPAGSGHAGAAAPAATRPAAALEHEAPPEEAGATAPLDFAPQAILAQSFTVEHPPDTVWAFFGRVADVAGCLTGVTLTGNPTDREAAGRMRVKVGPMVAEFNGVARIARDESTRTGEIVGSGKDKRSQSQTMGSVRYSVLQGPTAETTQVDLSIGYALTGVLAQFSRSGLVRDVATRLTAAFAANLETRLASDAAGEAAPPPQMAGEFNAGSLMMSVLVDRFRRLVAALLGRS
ncbi:MAG TPA: 2Fe-2S iron-sulfur cluster-binding protein [Roseiarcus sp.]|jgi:carbon-monoxide dehydrogenase small subunit|nr:2Fe-2S iron-sulfur cluster-binding protein [Roseiarcus sp.]